MCYHSGVTTKYDKVNRRTPVVPFRAPSRQHHEQIKNAAAEAGVTVSEWVRRAVARALAEAVAPAST
jgi:hypothetical protein